MNLILILTEISNQLKTSRIKYASRRRVKTIFTPWSIPFNLSKKRITRNRTNVKDFCLSRISNLGKRKEGIIHFKLLKRCLS